METYEDIVERYMKFDKKTLAELLALKELNQSDDRGLLRKRPSEFDIEPNPNTTPFWPFPEQPRTVPSIPPNYGDWTVTCILLK